MSLLKTTKWAGLSGPGEEGRKAGKPACLGGCRRKANVPSLFRGARDARSPLVPQAHFPASCLLLPPCAEQKSRPDRWTAFQSCLHACVRPAAHRLSQLVQEEGDALEYQGFLGLDLGLEICLVFFFFPIRKLKKKIMKYFKHSENNLVHIYSFLRFCGCEQCCLIYFRSLVFFFKKKSFPDITSLLVPSPLSPGTTWVFF